MDSARMISPGMGSVPLERGAAAIGLRPGTACRGPARMLPATSPERRLSGVRRAGCKGLCFCCCK